MPPALERSSYVWIASLLFILTCAWWREIPVVLYDVPWPWKGACLAVQLWGVWLTLRSAGVIDPLELAGIRQVLGRVRPPAFKVFGPYRLVRHPIYFGWALMTFGTPLMTGTRLSFAVDQHGLPDARDPVRGAFAHRGIRGRVPAPTRRAVRWRMVPGIC